MNKLSLQVPFIYRAQIIKPRCRKPVEIFVQDTMTVEIKCITESNIPVAFRVGTQETRLFDGRLWQKSFHRVTEDLKSSLCEEGNKMLDALKDVEKEETFDLFGQM